MTKLIYSIFMSILFLCFYNGFIHSIDVRTVDGIPQFPLYTYKGELIWTEREKAEILNAEPSVDTGTGTVIVKDSDFVAYSVPQLDQDIVSDLKKEGKRMTRTQFESELEKRKTVEYNTEKMREEQNRITFYKGLNISTGTYQDSYGKYEKRYQQLK